MDKQPSVGLLIGYCPECNGQYFKDGLRDTPHVCPASKAPVRQDERDS
jgi:hypothetical protein